MRKRKLVSLLIVFVLCIQLVVPAFASELPDLAETETITETILESTESETIPETLETVDNSSESVPTSSSETREETSENTAATITEAPANEPTSDETIEEAVEESELLPDFYIGEAYREGNFQEPDIAGSAVGLSEQPDTQNIDAMVSNLPFKYRTSSDELLLLQLEMLIYINALRLANGFEPVALCDPLSNAAMLRAEECALVFNDKHTRPDGSECFTVLSDMGIPYAIAGENIAKGHTSVEDVMIGKDGWWNSPGHRRNILSPAFQTVGIGYYVDNRGTKYWTQDFTGGYSLENIYYAGLKDKYNVGTSLQEEGILLFLEYSNGMYGYLPVLDDMIEGYNPNKEGKQTLTMYCQGLAFDVEIEVVDQVKQFVSRLYTQILGRNPDPAGLNAWTDVLKSGKEQGAKVAQGFITSKEFTDRNLSDKDYVTILYKTFFDRDPDPSGLQGWLGELDSGLSRLHVFRGFAESQEFTKICDSYGIKRGSAELTAPRDQKEGVTKFIARCYKLCLGRKADEDGLNAWCNQILTGANTAKEAAYGFVFSSEFINKKLSDEDYVKTLYRVFMDRESDPDGLNAWVRVLKSGKSREHVFNGFADSSEFRKICDDYGIK